MTKAHKKQATLKTFKQKTKSPTKNPLFTAQSFKRSEFDWPKSAKETGVQWPKEKRREYIAYMSCKVGLYNTNKREMAEMFGVNKSTLSDDIDSFYGQGIDPKSLEKTKVDLSNGMEHALSVARDVEAKATGEALRLKAAQAYADITAKHAEFLERFGIKQPIETEAVSKVTVVWGGVVPSAPPTPKKEALKEEERGV